LRLGESVGAVLLDRVLRRDQEKRLRKRPCCAVDRHLQLRHAFEERGLCLRESTVDLVDEDDVREDRTGLELELTRERVPDREARHVRRLEIRGALDARHRSLFDAAREGTRQDGLGRSRHVLEEYVATARKGRDHKPNRLLLADDDGLDIRQDALSDRRAGLDGVGRDGRRARPGRAHERPLAAGSIGSIVGEAAGAQRRSARGNERCRRGGTRKF
jgi:hypothetical protein